MLRQWQGEAPRLVRSFFSLFPHGFVKVGVLPSAAKVLLVAFEGA